MRNCVNREGQINCESCAFRNSCTDTNKKTLQELHTEQMNRVLAENLRLQQERDLLCAGLFSTVPLIILANLTKEEYRMLNYDDYTAKSCPYEGSYEELITIGASTIPENQRQEFIDTFSKKNMLQAYQQGKKSVGLVHRQVGDDGIIRWMDTQCAFVKDESTGDLCTITLARDVTDSKNMQLRLKTALMAANKATKAKSEFLARMSHDIRTPLNVIIGMSRLAQDNENPRDTTDCLEKIDIAGEFLLGLVNDVLDMERIESGKLELHLTPYTGPEFADYISAVIKPLCDQKEINFSYTFAGDNHFVIMQDKLRINQIYFNILANAVKFTPEGGHISFHTEVSRRNGKIALSVTIKDDGIGMSREFQDHLFEAFCQENTCTPTSIGTGLGLTIVKRMCDLMDMSIRVESAPGKGTTFYLYGEYEQASAAASKGTRPVTGAELEALEKRHELFKDKTILVCEDHPLNQEIVRRLLEKQGAIVEIAEDGRQGLRAFNRSMPNTYQVILMDVRMPGMNGLEAAAAIRSLTREDAAQVPIIALTANAYEEDVRACLEAGMNAHVAKPIEPKQLYEAILKYC